MEWNLTYDSNTHRVFTYNHVQQKFLKETFQLCCSHFQLLLLWPELTLTTFDWQSLHLGKEHPTILTIKTILNTPPLFHFLKLNGPWSLLMHILNSNIVAKFIRTTIFFFLFSFQRCRINICGANYRLWTYSQNIINYLNSGMQTVCSGLSPHRRQADTTQSHEAVWMRQMSVSTIWTPPPLHPLLSFYVSRLSFTLFISRVEMRLLVWLISARAESPFFSLGCSKSSKISFLAL